MKPTFALVVSLLFASPLLAQMNAEIKAKIASTIDAIHVKEGDSINKGTLLIQLDSRELKVKLEVARAEAERSSAIFAEVTARFERAKRLLQLGAINQAEFDAIAGEHANAQALLQAQRAKVDLMAANLNDTAILAPSDGVVENLKVRARDAVKADQVLLVLRNGADQPKDKVRDLLKERLGVLKKIAEVEMDRFKTGIGDYKSVLKARIAVNEAELELCETPAQRKDVLRKNVELLTEMNKNVANLYKSGKLPAIEALEVEVQLLEARIRLAREEEKK